LLLAASVPDTSSAQTRHHRKPVAAAAPVTIPCGEGLELRLSSADSTQGSLLLAELRSTQPITAIKADWNKHEVEFWRVTEPQPTSPATKSSAKPSAKSTKNRPVTPPHETWRALVGVDLEQPSGAYDLTIHPQISTATQPACTASISVKAGHFETEKLTVQKQFVEPDPEQAARAAEEGTRLRALYDTITPDRLWQGPFRVPLDGVTSGGNFGKRRVLNGTPRSPHTGVDFPAPTGTPIHASQRGKVVLAEPLYFSGNTVLIDHGLGVFTFYCHMVSIDAKVGDLVEPGTLLGKVGATGRVTGPHLHWGLTIDHARVNPLQIVHMPQIAR
jgi:hypothetical protein